MSSDRAVALARSLVVEAARRHGEGPGAAELAGCLARLDGPLRVALAGTVKAGKSTLLNALVGDEVAATDATECTKVVTWYHHAATPSVTLEHRGPGGAPTRSELPVRRRRGRLEVELGAVAAADVDRLDIGWPARALASTTLVDTPGTSSLSRDVSARTAALLTPPDAVPGVDAVVYLLRQLHETDVRFLRRLQEAGGADEGRGGVGVVGVLSRADEVGAGRLDALVAARDVATRLAAGPQLAGLCQTVLPVAGLLALGARTLRQEEYGAFRALAGVGREELALAMLSADRFARAESTLPVPAALREQVVRRFGVFGVRLAVAMVRSGVPDAPALAAELARRSGLDELRRVLGVQLGERADQLKVRSCLLTTRAVLAAHPDPGSAALLARVDALLADTHAFTELRLLGRLPTTTLELSPGERAELAQVLGGGGTSVVARLGVDPDSSLELMRARALDLVGAWRSRAGRPLAGSATVRACRAAARSAEGVLAELDY